MRRRRRLASSARFPLCQARDVLSHIDFGFVAGARSKPFDTHPLPVPGYFKECCDEAGSGEWGTWWELFVDECGWAYSVRP